jgi:hypothetical protein
MSPLTQQKQLLQNTHHSKTKLYSANLDSTQSKPITSEQQFLTTLQPNPTATTLNIPPQDHQNFSTTIGQILQPSLVRTDHFSLFHHDSPPPPPQVVIIVYPYVDVVECHMPTTPHAFRA